MKERIEGDAASRQSSRGPSRFVPLSLATIVATYVLIAVGSLVRAAGAGLGCPDWPRCFGGWIPPTHADELPAGFDPGQFNVWQTWLEYLNRLTGVTIGLFIFASMVSAWRHHRHQAHVFWPSLAAFVLVGFQGWLGGQVVAKELADDVLTAHMVLALVLVGVLVYAHLSARLGAAEHVGARQRRLGLWGLLLGFAMLLQAGVGTRVREVIDRLIAAGVPRDEWMPLGWWPDIAHRQFSVLLFMACVGLYLAAKKSVPEHRGLHTWALATTLVCGVQIALGLGLAYGAVPRPLQVGHLLFGSLLLGALSVFVYQAYRVAAPTGEGEGESEGRATSG